MPLCGFRDEPFFAHVVNTLPIHLVNMALEQGTIETGPPSTMYAYRCVEHEHFIQQTSDW